MKPSKFLHRSAWGLVASCLTLALDLPLPARSAEPQTPRSAEPMRLTVLSYNIHHAEGVDGKLDLDRVAKIIREAKPDIVGLQEVDARVARSKSVDQPNELARLTGLPHVVFGKNIDLQGGGYGCAILSRFPITTHENVPLPNVDQGEQRGVIRAELRIPGMDQPLIVLATHLDHRPDDRERVASAKAINGLVERTPDRPALLIGDMNAVIASPTLKLLDAQWQRTNTQPLPTIPVSKPERQIDFVFVRPALSDQSQPQRWKLIDTQVLDEPVASDHLPIVAVVELLP
jgi:endonuclease/exonuclease/phosphatase family metal-dependent hydrolase